MVAAGFRLSITSVATDRFNGSATDSPIPFAVVTVNVVAVRSTLVSVPPPFVIVPVPVALMVRVLSVVSASSPTPKPNESTKNESAALMVSAAPLLSMVVAPRTPSVPI